MSKKGLKKLSKSTRRMEEEDKALGMNIFSIKLQSDIISFMCFVCIKAITVVISDMMVLAIYYLTAKSIEL